MSNLIVGQYDPQRKFVTEGVVNNKAPEEKRYHEAYAYVLRSKKPRQYIYMFSDQMILVHRVEHTKVSKMFAFNTLQIENVEDSLRKYCCLLS